MDVDTLKTRLLDKEAELASAISRFRDEARDSRPGEVEDPIDTVISSEGKAAAFHESSMEYEMLEDVRDALRRMQEGTYGKCIDCGREIAPARLDAVPWARYCLDDQEKHDEASRAEDASLL